MSEHSETDLSIAWRSIMLSKMESLDRDVKLMQTDIRIALAATKDVDSIKGKVEVLEIEQADRKEEILKEVKEEYITKNQIALAISNEMNIIRERSILQDKAQVSQKEDILKEVKNTYVSKEELGPIKKIVFGAVGLILTAVITALITLILKK